MSSLVNLIPEVRADRCTRYHYRYSDCSRCADQCPHQALTLSDEGVSVDSGSCTGCALCAASCPTNVFRATNLPLVAIAKPASTSLNIVCTPSDLASDEEDVRVPCLGAIDVALFASLGLRGVDVTLRGSGHCEQCSHAPHGGDRLQALLDTLEEIAIFNQQDDSPRLLLEDVTESSGMDQRRAGRRQLFRRWLAKGAEAAQGSAQHGVEIPASAIRYAADFIPTRRQLAEKVVQQLGKPLSDEMIGLTWGMAYVTVGDNGCTGCEACARVCPTGALKVSEDDDWKLLTTAAKCVGCGVCIEACTTNSIELHHGWQPGDTPLLALHTLRRHRCQECGRYFVGLDDETCPVCSDDTDSFSAIFG